MSTIAAPPGTKARPATKPRPAFGWTARRWEAADTVVAASAALVAVIVGIFVLLCIQGYSRTIETTKERGQTAAGIVAEGTRWMVSSARVTLDGVASLIGNDPANADARTLAVFDTVAASVPTQFALGLYDAAGNAVAGASSPGVAASIAGTDYFTAIAAGADWSLSAQEQDAVSGEATFAVARRLETGGTFKGVAMVAIDAEVLRRLAEPQDLGEGSTISLVRTDGWIVARYPSVATALDLGGTASFQNINAGESGSYVSEASPVDGVARIVSFQHVDDLGYVAVAAISKEAALAGLWNAIWIVSLLIAPIAAALLAGSFLTARLLRRSQSTSRSLASALDNNQILFREIHHRVKNNLQSINSLMQLQPIPKAVKVDMSQRIAAMSAVHEHIYRSDSFAKVRVKGYLHTLIENIRAGYDPGVRVIEEIEDVAVDKDAATPLGLIVSEVVSNAFKHAFRDGRAGTVYVTLVAEEDGRARLTVRDNGVGFDPEAPASGIGRRLIKGFAAQLQADTSHVSGDGSTFSLVFPLAED